MSPEKRQENTPIRLLLVDDQSVVREGLRLLLENHPELQVVAEASNRLEATASAAREQPDVVLLDLDLGSDNGLDCLPELLAVATQTRILILTGINDLSIHSTAISRGAMGLVHKSEPSLVLVKAIKKVRAGEVWLDSRIMTHVLSEMWRARAASQFQIAAAKVATSIMLNCEVINHRDGQSDKQIEGNVAKISRLTNRERELVTLIGEGLRNKQIADRLFISPTTVRHHLSSIFDKLEVGDRFELAIYSYRHGLAKIPV